MGNIHVMDIPRADPAPGAPDGSGQRRRLVSGTERLCSQADGGEMVVFHPLAEPVGQYWRCPECGENSSGEVV